VAGSELEAAVQQLSPLIELAGGEELVVAGEVVGHEGISSNADGRLLLKWLFHGSLHEIEDPYVYRAKKNAGKITIAE
jgi:hypothetical protein